ncbi:RNA polymerase sigma-70 factor [Adhaeribacter pallidiroseus]|uniref:RNA polymerase sigma-70 factor n=1 Tax=Adhaeribacter pallidiroseus TaxID=2072847 RepID=A0A369QQ12_9BACT|nr:RNA polymerase sigma-70 factor [Adhaeribacter pallidiroseus]RDC64939.1 hypothetical protein AHMF7616_03561 [Adhaeribacter pallidiroseus]
MVASTAKQTSNPLSLKDLTDFDQIYRHYWSELFDRAYKRIQSVEKAEEIIQDLFVELWEKREQIEIRESLEAYLFGALKFRILNYLRHEKTLESHLRIIREHAVKTTNNLEEEIYINDLEAAYKNQVDNLPEKCRAVFELSRQEQLSFKEIALRLNVSVNTVEKHVGKALRVLRLHLKDFTFSLLLFWLS